ncbi:MAG: arginase family protein [Streptosporangiaceae bacterium]|nr:arginase family protein [Streptosporangiaceae bacterium]MBV9854220.1 arginase family protein [Streptosporangiaceae bacterium]
MRSWVFIGVPSSAGAHHAGQELAPAALRAAGLLERLRAAGVPVSDGGDLPVTPFELDPAPDAVAGAAAGSAAAAVRFRNLAAVARVAGLVRDRVASAIAEGETPLVVGGDCTITLGVVAGFGRDVRLVYVDGDTDLGPAGNADTPGSGILDSMGVAHLLGEGAPELTGLRGAVPLVSPERLALLGGDPRETSGTGRAFLAARGVHLDEGPSLAASPEGAVRRALAAVGSAGPLVVHFDADVIDSGDLPLANFPHYGSGVRPEQAFACLRELCLAGSPSGIVLTEVNPTHDPSGVLLGRYIDGVAAALAAAR